MQKNHKSKGGIVWGNIKKKTVSIFILHSFTQQISVNNCNSWQVVVVRSYVTVPALTVLTA